MKRHQRSADTHRSLFTSKDVVCGRGRELERHPGNVAFRRFIRQFSDEYASADRAKKSIMLAYLLQQMKESSVRIFKKYDNGHYEEVDDDVLKHKIGHALRDSRKFSKGMPVKTLTKNVPKTSSAPNATAKFAEASATLTLIESLTTSSGLRWFNQNGKLRKLGMILIHGKLYLNNLHQTSQLGASKGSDARLHERHANISPENERLCPTHVVDNTSEAVPLSMQMEPCESLAFEHAMGSTWTLKNSHHTCDDELEARAVTEDSTNCGGELDWHIEGLTCSGVEAIFRDFNADTNDEDIKGERAT
ncbi:hypothetical protein MHU86_8809 [Fragilaria crotonensis]|nr:hypothetical protein MHU86_8809 [Fragilaria crotonensis]